MMKTIFYLVATLLLGQMLSSCATILLNKTHYMEVRSNEQNAEIQVHDSIYTLPALFKVTRSKENLPITLKTDSLELDFTVESSLNTAFMYGNLPIPIGYLVDMTNNKRYSYGKSVYLDSKDTSRVIIPTLKDQALKREVEKGNLYFLLSIPHINTFSLVPEGEKRYTNTGFWGIGAGIDYYYQNNKFLNLSGAAVSDFFAPVPAAVDIEGDWTLMTSVYLSLSNNHRFGHLSVGYGLSFSKNTWDFKADTYIDGEYDYLRIDRSVKKSLNAIGFIFPVILDSERGVTLGMTYRPSFYRPSADRKFKYEALFSLSLNFKIGLIRKQ